MPDPAGSTRTRAGKAPLPGETQRYVADVSRRLAAAKSATAQAPASNAADPGDDPVSLALAGKASAAPAPAAAPADDAGDDPVSLALKAKSAPEPPPAAAAAQPTTAAGLARNAAAGVADAGQGVLGAVADPFGTLIGRPALTLGAAAYDAVAPLLGGSRLTPQQRAAILGTDQPAPFARPVNALAAGLGVDPAAVPATPAEAMTRAGVAGAATMALAGPAGVAGPLAGAGGAVAGRAASDAAPEWAKPAAELAGNVVGGGVVSGLVAGARGGVNALRAPGAAAGPEIVPTQAIADRLNSLAPTAPGQPPRFVAAPAAAADPVIAARLAASMPPDTRELAAAGGAAPPAANDAGGPSPGMGGPLRAAGADVTDPASVPPPTQPEASAALRSSVLSTATERAGPAMVDHTVYVPGVERPLAAREFSPLNSLDEKRSRAADPAFRQEIEAVERRNNETMVEHLAQDAGDPIILSRLHEARDAVAPPARQLFANETPVDASPLVAELDNMLAGPDGKRAGVASILRNVRGSLVDDAGNPETLPSRLYGARQNITDLLKKGASGDAAAADVRAAKSMLVDLLGRLDPVIGSGAPGFEPYLRDFAAASQPINAMEWLQQVPDRA